MSSVLSQLKTRLEDIQNINSSAALLSWEQQTYMPEGGAATRAGQLSTLSRIAHEMFTADETGKLLQDGKAELNGADYDSDDASLIRVTQHDYDLATKIPASLVAELSHHSTMAHNVWAKARAENNYPAFAPYLEKTVDLSRRLAEYLGYTDRIYDALLDQYEPDMKTAEVEMIFADLKKDVVPLVAAIVEHQDRANDDVLHRHYDLHKQNEFAVRVARDYGFDFHRGRQDKAVHPFCQSLSRDDVRITTRFDPNFLQMALFGTMHETGHGLYEQNVGANLPTRLASGTSLGVHESQSRLWENVVGRSRGFWKHYYPLLQDVFPESLADVDMETFYRAINTSKPSFIRVEADEVTYSLHIMLRFEMENELIEGKLKVADAPEAWNAKSKAYLGIVPPTDTLGILQDVHWSGGLMGYFATYSLGSMLASQLYEKAIAAVPSIPSDIEQGQFSSLLGWLRENIHVHGRKYKPQELVKRVTGEPLQSRSYVKYLRAKYGEIYSL